MCREIQKVFWWSVTSVVKGFKIRFATRVEYNDTWLKRVVSWIIMRRRGCLKILHVILTGWLAVLEEKVVDDRTSIPTNYVHMLHVFIPDCHWILNALCAYWSIAFPRSTKYVCPLAVSFLMKKICCNSSIGYGWIR